MEDTETIEILSQLDQLGKEFKAATGADGRISKDLAGIVARVTDMEQKLARRRGGDGPIQAKTWGESLVESPEFKALASSPNQKGKASVQVKTVQSLTTATGVGGALIAPEIITTPIALPKLRPTIRSLIAPGQTSSNAIWYARQLTRQNLAAAVAEGAQKPQSDMTFQQIQEPVQTIATFIIASRQLLDDAPAMMSTVDGELIYDLDFVEEVELLTGSGSGAHLHGIIPQATAFAAPWTGTGDTRVDTLLQAIGQTEQALLPATGMVLNTIDWLKMVALKDGMGRYLLADPQSMASPRLWSLPVVPTLAMTLGTFLVGSFFYASQIFDRMQAEIQVSTEDGTNFQLNLITVRAEKRLALAVKRPTAFITGTFPTAS